MHRQVQQAPKPKRSHHACSSQPQTHRHTGTHRDKHTYTHTHTHIHTYTHTHKRTCTRAREILLRRLLAKLLQWWLRTQSDDAASIPPFLLALSLLSRCQDDVGRNVSANAPCAAVSRVSELAPIAFLHAWPCAGVGCVFDSLAECLFFFSFPVACCFAIGVVFNFGYASGLMLPVCLPCHATQHPRLLRRW